MHVDDVDKKIIYYYRNGFKIKTMAEKTGLELKIITRKLARLRYHGLLKRWWDE